METAVNRLLAAAFALLFVVPALADEPYSPPIAGRSNEGQNAIQSFQLPKGMTAELVAAEPDLANPVCFCIDEKGRFYVGETFRQKKGVEDNRSHMNWLHDDLAAQTVADRVAFFRKHLGDKVEDYTKEHDRIRLLEDTDGDGVVDKATVFADGFNRIEDGTGAGLLARNGDVFYTCIPDLWKLRDEDGDGVADRRESLHNGYGVRVAFRGHDMHGLVTGPDGRLYFSIGDRGYNVTTKEGKRLVRPDTGAVFRCEPDGSQLEVFAYGLRNPQELAFDDYGNLFTGDNNSDSGDQARWVHVLKGSDTGWRMYFQYLPDRGPWNREMMWYPIDSELTKKGPGNVPAGSKARDLQPAYIVPPVANLGDGPSGLVAYPGVGLSKRYDGHFFLCDFRGNPSNSGIRSFGVKPKGASFELVDSHQFVWKTLVTDVDFGYDGSMYATDWVAGWDGPGKGRLYRYFDPEHRSAAKETAALFAAGFGELEQERLLELLDHDDRRVRQRAHLEIVDRVLQPAPADLETGPTSVFTEDGSELWYLLLRKSVERNKEPVRVRWHALAAVGRILRLTHSQAEGLPLHAWLTDPSPEIRALALRNSAEHPRVNEWCRRAEGTEFGSDASRFVAALRDGVASVRYEAAMTLGACGRPEEVPELLALADREEDPAIRHAVVMGLVGIAERHAGALDEFVEHPAERGRTSVLLAFRRLKSPKVAEFLDDSVLRIAWEAARAVHDVPIPEGMERLAEQGLTWQFQSDASARRVMNANYRLGGTERAYRVADFVKQIQLPEATRLEAVEQLRTWGEPHPIDRVTGRWAPLDTRSKDEAKPAVREILGTLLAASPPLRKAGVALAADYGIDDVAPTLVRLLEDDEQTAEIRADALNALDAVGFDDLEETASRALADAAPAVRAAARGILVKRQPSRASELLGSAIVDGTTFEKQEAIAQLKTLPLAASRELLGSLGSQLATRELPSAVHLDVLQALAATNDVELAAFVRKYDRSRSPDDTLAEFTECIEGGSVERGKAIFFGRSAASCRRCHMVQGSGGVVGPNLSAIGKEKDRRYLLEAIVHPNAKIAKGFDTVVVATTDGKVHAGILKAETEESLTLMKPDGQLVVVPQDDVDDRAKGKSGMPEDLVKQLSKADLRDLVAYLASCGTPQKGTGHSE